MPYFIIEKMPVFLSWARYRILEEEAVEDKEAVWRISSKIAGSKATEEKSALMYDILQRKFTKHPNTFRSEWVHFDLSGGEASANVWDLLYDYCHFRGYAFLSDIRDPLEEVVADYKGENYHHPMGRVFSKNHFVRPAKWWWRFTRGMRGRTIGVLINSD